MVAIASSTSFKFCPRINQNGICLVWCWRKATDINSSSLNKAPLNLHQGRKVQRDYIPDYFNLFLVVTRRERETMDVP